MTLLAPTTEAWDRYLQSHGYPHFPAYLDNRPDFRFEALHVLRGSTARDDFEHGQVLPTWSGQSIIVEGVDESYRFRINGPVNARLGNIELRATNGFIHTIDTVLDWPQ